MRRCQVNSDFKSVKQGKVLLQRTSEHVTGGHSESKTRCVLVLGLWKRFNQQL